jgi:hypothetical protein
MISMYLVFVFVCLCVVARCDICEIRPNGEAYNELFVGKPHKLFFMASTPPEKDRLIRAIYAGRYEEENIKMWEHVLSNNCNRARSSSNLVVDVGANHGHFSLLSAVHGCRVKAYEPQQRIAEYFCLSRLMNFPLSFKDTATDLETKARANTESAPSTESSMIEINWAAVGNSSGGHVFLEETDSSGKYG